MSFPMYLPIRQQDAANFGSLLVVADTSKAFPVPTPFPTPSPTASITVTPGTITAGQSAARAWNTTNAQTVIINGAVVAASGSDTVTPTANTTYSLSANGAGGTALASAFVTVQAPIPGDINGDGHVDLTDLTILSAHWQTHVPANTLGDLNGDGFVDMTDLTILAGNWGKSNVGVGGALGTASVLLESARTIPGVKEEFLRAVESVNVR